RKGAIRGIPLNIPLNELNEAIKYENPSISINNLFRLKRKDGTTRKWVDSQSIYITFKDQDLPKAVRVWKVSLPVTVYIPPLRRCFRYGRFGHTSKGCPKEEDICLSCGNAHSLTKDNLCSDKSKCINCQEAHHTLSRECQVFKLNLSINEAIVLDNISYVEAR
ncbi:hypothetical protein EAG_14151, partial [Camponotus floridanus]